MSTETEKDPQWQKGNTSGYNPQLLNIATSLARLQRLAIEKKVADMKMHINVECTKMNHPAATLFAEEINKIKVE
jgi:hypothetical protein